MHWVEVDGVPMPALLAGHPGLELCNTWAGWDEPPGPNREWLPDFDRLAIWSGHAGLVSPLAVPRLRDHGRRHPAHAAAALAATRRFRTDLHDTLLDSGDTAAFERVAAQAHRAAATAVLTAGSDGIATWTLPAAIGVDLPLLACARAAADLLCTPARNRVRACPGHDCGWLFLDPRGRRRWCSMAVCGNRAKVRAYADRHRPG